MVLHENGRLTPFIMGKPLVLLLLLWFAAHAEALPIEVEPRESSSNSDIATSWTIVGSVAGILAVLAYILGKFVLPKIRARKAEQESTYQPRFPYLSKLT